MTITQNLCGTSLQLALEGRLDTMTSPKLDKALKPLINDITHLELDLAMLEYISSAGLRVLLAAQKQMNQQGDMVVRNVSEDVMEVFEITGFTNILTIE